MLSPLLEWKPAPPLASSNCLPCRRSRVRIPSAAWRDACKSRAFRLWQPDSASVPTDTEWTPSSPATAARCEKPLICRPSASAAPTTLCVGSPGARCSHAACGPEDVWDQRLEALSREAKALDLLDVEPGLHDCRGGITGWVAAAGDRWPDSGAIDYLEQQPLRLAARDDVLVEAQLTLRSQHPADFGEGSLLIGDGAEHQARHRDVGARVVERQLVRDSGKHPDRDGCGRGGRLGLAAQRGLGLDRYDLGDLGRVEREVKAVAGADLDDGSAQSLEQASPVVGRPALLGAGGTAYVHAGEARTCGVGRCHVAPPTWAVAPARATTPSTIRPMACEKRSGETARDPCSMWCDQRPTP